MFDIYGNSPVEILIALAVAAAVVGVGVGFQSVLLRRVLVFIKKTEGGFDDFFVLFVRSLGVRFYVVLGAWVGLRFFLTLSTAVVSIIDTVFVVFLGLQTIVIVFRAIDFGIKRYVKKLDKSRRSLATALPSLGLFLKIFVSAFVFVFMLSNLGVEVTTLIAGLGIAGLAFAFASRKILADLFSTFVIFFDKPFSVGDTVEFGDVSGTVEYVGIKTTRVRAFTGERIVVPNADVVKGVLRNTTNQPLRKVVLVIPISYANDSKKLAAVSGVVEKVFSSYEKVNFGHAKAREFSPRGIMFEISYEAKRASYDYHVDIRHQIHLQVLQAFAKEKIIFGYS